MRYLHTAQFKRFLLAWTLAGVMVLVPLAGLPSVTADAAQPPEPADKNAVFDAGPGSAPSALPGAGGAQLDLSPAGKNAAGGPQDPQAVVPEEAEVTLPTPGSKNDGGAPEGVLPAGEAALLAAAGGLLTCGQQANLDWTTTSGDFQVIHYCTLRVPSDGSVFISATGSVARTDGPYEGQFRVDIDSTAGDENVDRWVNIYDDAGDGSDETLALSVLKPISAGNHTFYFLGRRYGGSGTLLLYDPTLTVVFVPATTSQTRICGASGNANWTTNSGTFEVMRQCALSLPEPGWLFIAANGSVSRQDGPYEANFRIGINNTAGDDDIDRWVDVWTDNGDGTDRSYALSVYKQVAAGHYTFYSLGRRSVGSASVRVYDPTLTVLYIPASSLVAKACGASGNLSWTTTSGTFDVMRQCTMTVPQDGWVFFFADASLGRQDGPYEADFRIGIDDTAGDPNADRWVNVYNDTGDGTDKSVALTLRRPVKAGTHKFFFLARRQSGTSVVKVYDPTLTVIVPGGRTYLPHVGKRW